MSRFTDKCREINRDWNDLPRRGLWAAGLIAGLWLIFALFRYVAPFALAALFAWMLEPLVRNATRALGGGRLARGVAAGTFILVLSGLLILLLTMLTSRLFKEAKDLAATLPGWVSAASTDILAWSEGLELDLGFFTIDIEDALVRLTAEAASLLTTLASRVAPSAARGAWRVAGFLPQAILFVVLLLLGVFYMSADKERIMGYIRGLLPEKHRRRSTLFRASILRAVLTQIRAALIMLAVVFAELSAGFLVMGIDYAMLFALLIAVLDAMPVVGAGLFLIPMCVYGIVVSNVKIALAGGVLYLLTIVLRQLMEPRIIGRQLGLHPLATMMAMYAGLRLMGVAGMLLGPLTLLLCKVAITSGDAAAPQPEPGAAQGKKPLLRWRKGTGD